jgi:hypothetical protein
MLESDRVVMIMRFEVSRFGVKDSSLRPMMGVNRPVPAVLHQLVQHGTDPDRAGKGEAQGHVAGDELLEGAVHRINGESVGAVRADGNP